MPEKLPRFIDFEASGNNYTYPIEVAWSDESGNVESHLISRQGVAEWREWSWSKWAIHRIWPWQLRWFGKSPAQVCALMDEALRGGELYCDGPPWDADWLDKLFKAAGRSADHFTIVGIDKLACIDRLDDQTRGELEAEASRHTGRKHRAGHDVQGLVELYKRARDLGQ